ncbi:MAG: hypothetical protein JXL67_14400 [Calditrichaeota bacterium]|nr:hypothetical protein [Calditrichota bacterium]
MSVKIRFISIIMLFLIAGNYSSSQAQLEDLITRYAGENGEEYVKPLITAFGANLNSGLYRSAHVPKIGLHFNIALNGMVAVFSDDQRTFTATTTGYFYPLDEVETSTVVGDPEGATVTSPSGAEYVFPGGYDMKSFMIAAPTITVGSIFGTEASLRYFKATLSEDIGDLTLLGLGIRHSLSQYIPLSPLDIAAGFFYHQFKISDIVKSNVTSIHAEVGKSFPVINLYGGMAYETNKATLDYTFDTGIETADVSLDVSGENKFRVILGVGFNFTLLHINLDYNIGQQQVLNAGLSIGL